mmetsp:Transcript_211/g.230  ORF Transcript_211/g.230 Transcript_211/m.230 type:complete len:214 (+) Transcript_211:727-1368(+)
MGLVFGSARERDTIHEDILRADEKPNRRTTESSYDCRTLSYSMFHARSMRRRAHSVRLPTNSLIAVAARFGIEEDEALVDEDNGRGSLIPPSPPPFPPTASGWNSRNALELTAEFRTKISRAVGEISSSFGSRSNIVPANQPSTTVIRFSVRVPVLSEQMAVAPPMVSQAANTRTKLLSFIIFFIEYAKEIVTASGKPSGTATTTMVMLYSRN